MFKAKPCLVCLEKDKRIASLEQSFKYLNDRHDKHVAFLHNQLHPGPQLPQIDYEASRIMDGGTEEPLPVLSEAEQAKIVAIEDERNKLLSGNYE